MDFKKWLYITEMAHVGMKQPIKIACAKFSNGIHIPCIDEPIAMMDMRFEDPGAYHPPYNKLGNFSKFSAAIPGKSDYIAYQGAGWAEVMSNTIAMQHGFVPVLDNQIDKTPGAISEKGFLLLPDDWLIHAQLVGIKGNIVKPAFGDVSTPDYPEGSRQAFMNGKYNAKKNSDI